MRIFITVLVLIFSFQSWTKADDIREFELEGMSVGDSLLDYFSKSEIQKKINSDNTVFYNKDFMSISLSYKTGKFKNYDDVGVVLKQNDKQYKIYSLEGTLTEVNGKIEDCYKKQNLIAKEIEIIIDSKYKRDIWFVKKKRLKPHQLSIKYLDFISVNGRRPFSLVCYDIKKNKKYTSLYLAVDSQEFDEYLDTY
jgi:hypothetical protein